MKQFIHEMKERSEVQLSYFSVVVEQRGEALQFVAKLM
jgi:hypothetical protein